MFVLLWGEIEKVIRIHIQRQPYQDNDGKCYEARAVGHCCEERKQEYPEGRIVSQPDDRERMCEALFV